MKSMNVSFTVFPGIREKQIPGSNLMISIWMRASENAPVHAMTCSNFI